MLAALATLPWIRRGALGLGLLLALPCLLSAGVADATPAKPTRRSAAATTGPQPDVVPLAKAWRFISDPTDKGIPSAENWTAPNYNDSAWRTVQAGVPWEKQGVNYAGNAWYRQKITVPASVAGISPTLVLQEIQSDDEVYFNGVRIGGLTGEYKYADLLKRAYTIPANLVRAGAENTIAIRVWGGPLGFNDQNSGLVGPLTDAYYLEFDRYRLGARGVDAQSPEVPIQLYDFSGAQRGAPFRLMARVPACGTNGAALTARYELTDLFKAKIISGDVPTTVGDDGTCLADIPIQARDAQTVYFAGRFTAKVTVVDGAGSTVATRDWVADHLRFENRDQQSLPALAEQLDDTPYGRLKLLDTIDTATAPADDAHPYMQGAMGGTDLRNTTPGPKATVAVSTILGKSSRQATWSWFAYRVGRGQMQPGRSYLLRIEYPEDVARYMPVEVQAGQNYMDVGFKTGISASNPYERAPLSKRWETYDIVFTLGDETTATGGAGDGDASKGVWLYFLDKRKANTYFIPFSGGVAVGSIKMYEIDPKANAPKITRPSAGVPERTLMMDWERQPTSRPEDVVSYAALMGYSAVSPTILKWGTQNFGVPMGGYTTTSVDAHRYWNRRYDCQKTVTCAMKSPPPEGTVHERYLASTKAAGVDYIPRVEYGGSDLLETGARAIGADGNLAKPNRYADWAADLLDDRTFVDFKRYLDTQVGAVASSNPQLKGVLWRIRSDRMPISYSRADVERFLRETGRPIPSDFATLPPVGVAGLVASGELREPYIAWWHQQRAAFHARIADTLQAYGNGMKLFYFNWDNDKFSLALPDRNSAAFTTRIVQVGGNRAYADDLTARSRLTAADYIRILREGDFSGSVQLPQRWPIETKWPDYALWPSLYANITNVALLAPMAGYPYADMQELHDYFRTGAGLAVSYLPPYEEFSMRVPHPKYETNVVTPGGGNFSLSTEFLSYFYGDANVLTFTSYTIGRGFADAHRRFAQAFRALPAVPGEDIASSSADLKVRLYITTLGEKYLGVAYKGATAADFSFNVTTSSAQARLTDLGGSNGAVKGVAGQGKLAVTVRMQPMELRAFRLTE